VDEGAHVVITGRREKELKEAAASIKTNVTTVVSDVSRLEDLDRSMPVVKEKHGHIDILFANAGAGTIAPLAVATEAHFDQTFDVNVKGMFLYGAEGPSPLQRRRFDDPELFGLKRARASRIYAYAASKGGCSQLRARLGFGIERPQDPRELYEPGAIDTPA